MIAVFFGKDDFSANEALASLRAQLDTDGMLSDNIVRVDGPSAKPDELLILCQTLPFLSAHRLIVVNGLLARFERAQGRGRRRAQSDGALGAWEPFVAALPSLPPVTTLVFLEGELSARNALLAAIRLHAQVREFKPLLQNEVAAWINERAPRHGVTLEARAVAALAQLVGNQLWTLDSELQKLGTYAGGRPVSESDVRALVSLAREPSVFAMADAVVEGRAHDAADLLLRLLADGDSPQRLLAMLARHYRLLLLTKELQERRVKPQEIGTRLQVQGFVMQRLLKQAPAYTIERLRAAYHKLLDTDLSIKRGVFDDETALQLLVFELATLASATPPDGRRGYSRPPGGPGRPPPQPARPPSGRS
jgi:DNA polymerase-3 subunit delta